jgi:hypothetical protein
MLLDGGQDCFDFRMRARSQACRDDGTRRKILKDFSAQPEPTGIKSDGQLFGHAKSCPSLFLRPHKILN